MSNVLIVRSGNFKNLRKFIIDLCSSSGTVSGKIIIEQEPRKNRGAYHIVILSQVAAQEEIYHALEHIVPNGTVIINSDEKILSGFKLNKPIRLITYGFNPKATVTISSVSENGTAKVQCCVQRAFSTLEGGIIEPQEFIINSPGPHLSVNDMLAAAVAAAMCGACVDKFLFLT